MKRIILGQNMITINSTVMDNIGQVRFHIQDEVGIPTHRTHFTTREQVIEDIRKSEVTLTFTTKESVGNIIDILSRIYNDMN